MENRMLDNKSQSVILENRQNITITGVEKVENFNEKVIVTMTIKGMITIKGNLLDISKLNLDEGVMKIEGSIDSVVYSNKTSSSKGNGFFSKLFK